MTAPRTQEPGSTVGVEEEFLLVDPESGRPAPLAPAVLKRAATGLPSAPDAALHAELHRAQVEAASGRCTHLSALRTQLWRARGQLAAAARDEGVWLVSTGTPVIGAETAPPLTSGERFDRIGRLYAGVVTDYQSCGCHVHVGLADRETAVAVVNHLRPWIPTLVALASNSPFDHGTDTGYASWRLIEQARFPGSGVPPWFASAAAYDEELERQIRCGVLVDERMTFWLVRLSPHLPTIEFRAADASSSVEGALLQAALSRALVRTALADLALGREAPNVPATVLTAAVWSAARYGLSGPAVHPFAHRQAPATDLLREVVRLVTPALEETGDLAEVRCLVAATIRSGTGADAQRRAAVDGLRHVVSMLAEHTQPGQTAQREGTGEGGGGTH